MIWDKAISLQASLIIWISLMTVHHSLHQLTLCQYSAGSHDVMHLTRSFFVSRQSTVSAWLSVWQSGLKQVFCYCRFFRECVGERILKIGHYFLNCSCSVFPTNRVEWSRTSWKVTRCEVADFQYKYNIVIYCSHCIKAEEMCMVFSCHAEGAVWNVEV